MPVYPGALPPTQRATISGVCLMASQLGGALAPLLVVPIQARWGWRASFFAFGALGALWATIWYLWFRDSPAEKTGGVPAIDSKSAVEYAHSLKFPWRAAFRSKTVWAFLATAFCYVYVYNFFQTWFHTFLVKGRGFSEESPLLSSLPYVVAAFSNIAGGAASDTLTRRLGRTNGRRLVGCGALAAASACTIAAMGAHQQLPTVIFLPLVHGAITFQQSGAFGVCLDIGHKNAGAVVGLFNMASQVGGLVGSVAYGYIVDRFHSYDAPFIPMAAVLLLGAFLWLKIDASQELSPQAASAAAV
jgi:predicted MFS family arabinose efflux permease